jgi:hypothetical protein
LLSEARTADEEKQGYEKVQHNERHNVHPLSGTTAQPDPSFCNKYRRWVIYVVVSAHSTGLQPWDCHR